MMHAVKIAPSVKRPRLALLLVAVAGLGLAGCNYEGGDPRKEIGANPPLPALQQYLIPPIHIAKVAAWGKETPTVPEGLQIHALATGFEHPRSLYVLPNGDVLVVESNGPPAPIYRPKDIVTNWVTWLAGAAATGGNRITLLRDTNGDGIPEVRTVFLDHLNSPLASRWSAMIFMSPTPTPSSAIPIRKGKPLSRPPAPSSPTFLADRSIITGQKVCWPVRTAPSSMSG
jgi:glucose/arabinose dehydrogenase